MSNALISEVLLENYIKDFIQDQYLQDAQFLQENIFKNTANFFKSAYRKFRFDKENYDAAEEALEKSSKEKKKKIYQAIMDKEINKSMKFDAAAVTIIGLIMWAQGLTGQSGADNVMDQIAENPEIVEQVLENPQSNKDFLRSNTNSNNVNNADRRNFDSAIRSAVDFSTVDLDGLEMCREQFNLWRSLNDKLDLAGYPYFDPNIFIEYSHLFDKKSADKIITSYINVMNEKRSKGEEIVSYEDFFSLTEEANQLELQQSALDAERAELANVIINDGIENLIIDDSSKESALDDLDGINEFISKQKNNINEKLKSLDSNSDEYKELSQESFRLHSIEQKMNKISTIFNNMEDGKFSNDSFRRYAENEDVDVKQFLNNYLDDNNKLNI